MTTLKYLNHAVPTALKGLKEVKHIYTVSNIDIHDTLPKIVCLLQFFSYFILLYFAKKH